MFTRIVVGMADTFWARINQESAGNDAINLEKDIAPVEITFVPKGTGGDTFLDPGLDPNTQVEINGTLYDFEYIVYGTLPSAQQVPDQFEGDPVAIIRVIGYPTATETERLVFLPEANATQADMASFQQGNISPVQPVVLPQVPVCFAGGTLIETPAGPVPVDDLRQGDLVVTVDNGPQPLVWVTSSHHVWPGSDEIFKPVQIKAGALGAGLPRCDLMVSPQHHILLGNLHGADMFGAPEVIAPAKGLTGLAGVRHMKGKKDVTYFHLMLDKHALLWAGGIASESFYPGPTAIKMLNDAQRASLLRKFPALLDNPDTGYGPTVRHKITRRQAEMLVSRMSGVTGLPQKAA